MISEAQEEAINGVNEDIIGKLGFTTTDLPESANSLDTGNEHSLAAIVGDIRSKNRPNRKRSPETKTVDILAASRPVPHKHGPHTRTRG